MIQRNQWQRLSALLDEALDLPYAERAAWLANLANTDPGTAKSLARLLPDEDGDAETAARAFERWLGPALEEPDLAPGHDLSGTRLGAWQLVEKIGEGGMGQVCPWYRPAGRMACTRGRRPSSCCAATCPPKAWPDALRASAPPWPG
jgi:hypothetical protein